MDEAIKKVEAPLMERYTTTCHVCGYIRQHFGTKDEARASAERMGWEFRISHRIPRIEKLRLWHEQLPMEPVELAYCPHCKLLVKG